MTVPASSTDAPTGNVFLDALPSGSRHELLRHAGTASLPAGFGCLTIGKPVERVRFPLDGLISTVGRLQNGSVHEVGFVGRDGAIGALDVLFNGPTLYDSFVQIPGTCLEIDAMIFAENVRADPALQDSLIRLAHASLATAAQSSLCNGSHSVLERSAKWLLLAHDRVAGDSLRLTHEFLGEMLNVRRAGVTQAAAHLRSLDAIFYRRGTIAITNRAVLLALSCECYGSINDNAATVLGFDIRKTGALQGARPAWPPSCLRPIPAHSRGRDDFGPPRGGTMPA